MPTVLYKWDFETGDTQGWVLGSYSTLDSSSKVQGVYSIRYGLSPSTSVENTVMSISNIDLSTASNALLIMLVYDESSGAIGYTETKVNIKDSSGNILLSYTERVKAGGLATMKVLAFDLRPVVGRSGLTIEIRQYNSVYGSPATISTYYDNIMIIDGGDKEYQIALMGLNNTDRTLTYSIPSPDNALPSGVTRYAITLANPPHPLSESSDIFTYTAICDQGSASITSTDSSNKHASPITAPSTAPSYFNALSVRIYPTTASTTWYGYDKTVVVTFWDALWNLKAVYVFRVAITINPYSPTFASALINTTYGSAWSGQRDFTVKIHARSLSARIYVRFLVGDNTVVQTGTVKLEVFSSDYSTKYGESSVDLTTGTALRGATISNLPVDTTLVFRISWSITANARVVLEVRPELIVY